MGTGKLFKKMEKSTVIKKIKKSLISYIDKEHKQFTLEKGHPGYGGQKRYKAISIEYIYLHIFEKKYNAALIMGVIVELVKEDKLYLQLCNHANGGDIVITPKGNYIKRPHSLVYLSQCDDLLKGREYFTIPPFVTGDKYSEKYLNSLYKLNSILECYYNDQMYEFINLKEDRQLINEEVSTA